MENAIIIANVNKPAFTNKALNKATEKIFKIGETVRKCAFETAFIMAEVDSNKCYEDDGFKNVHDWAMKTFGFKKSSSYDLLRIGKEYTREILNEKGKVIGFGSNLVDNDDPDFSTVQIQKMLPAGHDLVETLVEDEEITPDMTAREIAEVIKTHTQPEADPETESEVEADPETESEVEAETESEKVIVTDDFGVMYEIPVEILAKYRIN